MIDSKLFKVERKAFETHIRTKVYPQANEKIVERRENGEYRIAHIEMMWCGWWRRAASEIKLK